MGQQQLLALGRFLLRKLGQSSAQPFKKRFRAVTLVLKLRCSNCPCPPFEPPDYRVSRTSTQCSGALGNHRPCFDRRLKPSSVPHHGAQCCSVARARRCHSAQLWAPLLPRFMPPPPQVTLIAARSCRYRCCICPPAAMRAAKKSSGQRAGVRRRLLRAIRCCAACWSAVGAALKSATAEVGNLGCCHYKLRPQRPGRARGSAASFGPAQLATYEPPGAFSSPFCHRPRCCRRWGKLPLYHAPAARG
jgi:hypothetical protein